jgi:glycosyltransferase involved in cell wall biosynthesis
MMEKWKEYEYLENTSAKGQPSFSRDLNQKETNPEISVVILAYRTGEGIREFVESMVQSLDKNEPSWEIVLVGNHLVDDGDLTPHIVNEIAHSHPRIRSVTRIKEGMMGWDMKSGLEVAKGQTIAVIDGDGQMPFEDVIHVYKKLKDEGLDLVKTFRTQRGDGFYRKTISVGYNILFNILFPGTNCMDVNSKPKIITREVYNRMRLNSNGWFIDSEIMIQARKMNLKVCEIPTVFFQINYRPSFVNLKSIWEFSVNLLWYRLFNRSKM